MQPSTLGRRVAHPILIIVLTLVILTGQYGFAYAAPGEQKIYYYLPDHLGGVDKMTDEQGNVVCSNDYLPFGDIRRGDCTASDEDYGFTGKEKDPETGLMYYGARYYDALIGRFISPDPWEGNLEDPQTLNKYSYVLNNPLKFIDPFGWFNAKTETVERGDTLSSITPLLNEKYGMNYAVGDYAKINELQDPDKIYPGQRIHNGTIDAEGNVWRPIDDPAMITGEMWNSLTVIQKFLHHIYSSAFQSVPKRPPNPSDPNWKNEEESPTHNLAGASGNISYRGLGPNAGLQPVYDPDGNLVETPENMGTLDTPAPLGFIPTLLHIRMNVVPWIAWGNSPADTTTQTERLGAAFKTLIHNINKKLH